MKTEPEQKEDARLAQLVLMLGTSALQQMGKLVHPATGKAEVDLEGAQFSIDLLEMLERKTRGNLTEDEKRFLADHLTNLRLNYVEVSREAAAKGPAAGGKPDGKPPAAAEPAPAEDGKTNGVQGADRPDGEAPRFHKSYG